MAGFGIVIDYLFYAVVGLIVAGIAAGVLVLLARKYVPSDTPSRGGLIRRCIRTPFLGWVLVLAVWIVYSCALELVFHRDNGLSADLHAPMPNGYIVGNVSYSFGYLLAPEDRRENSYPKDSPYSVVGITYLQESEPYLLGSRYVSGYPAHVRRSEFDKEYFFIDTRTRQVLRFDSLDELCSAASARGVTVEFEENWCVGRWEAYGKYRPIWFDWFFPIASLMGLGYLIGSLFLAARKERKSVLVHAA
jgi:hypothetical protein